MFPGSDATYFFATVRILQVPCGYRLLVLNDCGIYMFLLGDASPREARNAYLEGVTDESDRFLTELIFGKSAKKNAAKIEAGIGAALEDIRKGIAGDLDEAQSKDMQKRMWFFRKEEFRIVGIGVDEEGDEALFAMRLKLSKGAFRNLKFRFWMEGSERFGEIQNAIRKYCSVDALVVDGAEVKKLELDLRRWLRVSLALGVLGVFAKFIERKPTSDIDLAISGCVVILICLIAIYKVTRSSLCLRQIFRQGQEYRLR